MPRFGTPCQALTQLVLALTLRIAFPCLALAPNRLATFFPRPRSSCYALPLLWNALLRLALPSDHLATTCPRSGVPCLALACLSKIFHDFSTLRTILLKPWHALSILGTSIRALPPLGDALKTLIVLRPRPNDPNQTNQQRREMTPGWASISPAW